MTKSDNEPLTVNVVTASLAQSELGDPANRERVCCEGTLRHKTDDLPTGAIQVDVAATTFSLEIAAAALLGDCLMSVDRLTPHTPTPLATRTWLSFGDNLTSNTEHRGTDGEATSPGSLTFLNVAIATGGDLERPDIGGVFRFALARNEDPFLISTPPYGGGAYLTLSSEWSHSLEPPARMTLGQSGAITLDALRVRIQARARIPTLELRERTHDAYGAHAEPMEVSGLPLPEGTASTNVEGFVWVSMTVSVGPYAKITFEFSATINLSTSDTKLLVAGALLE